MEHGLILAVPSTPLRTQTAVRLALPPEATAPGFRKAMAEEAGLVATFPDAHTAVIERSPAVSLIAAHRLASRGESRERMWRILSEYPRRDQPSQHEQRAIEEINRMADLETPEGMLSALSLMLLVTSNQRLRSTLEPQLDGLWTSLPDATFWLITAAPALLARMSLMQLLFQFAYTPDIELGDLAADHRRSFAAQSMTSRISTSDLVQPVFLLFSPAVTGFAAPWLPHTLALEFGAVVDLRRPHPLSLNALYEPRVLSPPINEEGRDAWINSVPKATLASLLAWWVNRLDLLYGLITDPTRFSTPDGGHDSAGQLAFMLTVERVLADLRSLNASPQAPALVKLGTTFDLLDKLETLLGYGPRSRREHGDKWRSGAGFARLLDASESEPLMRRGFERMPQQIARRFADRGEALFATMYAELRDGVLPARLTDDGILVGRDTQAIMPTNEYAGRLIRAVRNSSHGLLDQVAGREADVATTHTGALPDTLPDLVSLIAVALLADPERLWSMDVWQ